MVTEAEIRQYNQDVRAAKSEANRVAGVIEYRKNDVIARCKQLSQALGMEVTPANVADVAKQIEEKITKDLQEGREILQRVAAADIGDSRTAEEVKNLQQEADMFARSAAMSVESAAETGVNLDFSQNNGGVNFEDQRFNFKGGNQ